MSETIIEFVCKDPGARIPKEFRVNKQEGAKFLLGASQMSEGEIKNPGYWAIKRWLDDSKTSDDFEEILTIEKVGEERTYDLTVPDGNSFSASGFTVHNCNLPNNATKETVDAVYMRAWKEGCKGFTVYRDGCRTGVLVSTEEKKDEKPKTAADVHPKRPKELQCDIHRVNVKDESGKSQSWMVLVGLNDGKPYEVFSGLANHIEVPKKSKTGTLIKNGKINGISTYNLRVPVGSDDEILFKDVANLFANPTQGAFSRTISLALRHGVLVNFVVDQLQKDKESDMFTYARCIARVLKGYIPDGTKSTNEKKCKECGSDQVFYMEGCLTCQSCGGSRCS